MQTQTSTSVLGMNISELSIRDICEEITDINHDLSVIDDYEKGNISYGEMTRETSFLPKDKQRLLDAITSLRAEKSKRNN